MPGCGPKILITDTLIFVVVEPIKYFFNCMFWGFKPPGKYHVSEFIKLYVSSSRFVHFYKCLLKRLVLLMQLINDSFLQILVTNDLPYLLLPLFILHHNFFRIFLILGIFHTIVPEIEGFGGLNDLAEPSREVCIIYLRGFLGVLHLDQHFQEVEIEFGATTGATNKFCEILGSYETVIILVEV